jgi:hypothetical protein
MTFPLIPLAILWMVTLVGEMVLWNLFRKRVGPMLFPHEVDTSFMRFFSLPRLRIVAIAHYLVLCVLVTIFFMFLW